MQFIYRRQNQHAFTIVELLIVIVVIGILAAITIVAFNGVQSRARDASLSSSVVSLEKGLKLYNAENGTFPSSLGCADDSGCSVGGLSTALVPKYMPLIPSILANVGVSYARNTGGIGYGLNIPYETKARCVSGENPNMGWGWFNSTGLKIC